ncbi:hypothetical protein [Sphingomonas faeni]|uniref:hypothetical protein n=1 Tax=Sphingomonas faeni TaxID=185950 RepID=UPI00335EA763
MTGHHPPRQGAARQSEHGADLPGYAEARSRLICEQSSEHLALFRRHLAPAIKAASPIVAALCESGLDLSFTLNWMNPPFERQPKPKPWWATPSPTSADPPSPSEHARAFRLRHRRLGVIERWPTDPLGRLGIRLRSGCLNVEVSIGDHVLWTAGANAHLMFDATIPATVAAAMPGATIGQIVSHPLLKGHYVVTAVEQFDEGWTGISFLTGTVECKAAIVAGDLVVGVGTAGRG